MIEIKIEKEDLEKKFKEAYSKQIPFAFSRTLNEMGKKSQGRVVEELREKFIIRKDWTKESGKFGVRIRYSTKHKLETNIYSQAPWLPIHIEGGEQRPARSRNIAIPQESVWPNRGSLLPSSKRISRLQRRTFFVRAKSGVDLLLQRVRSGKKGRVSDGRRYSSKSIVRTLYVLRPSVQIEKRFDFRNQITDLINKIFKSNFIRNLKDAIR